MTAAELHAFLEVLPVAAMVMIGRKVIGANQRMGAPRGLGIDRRGGLSRR